MMRLLIDAHVFDGKYQGSRTYLEGLYKAVIELVNEKGLRLELFFAAGNVALLRSVFGDHDFVHYLKLPPGTRLLRLGWHYPRLLRRWEIDVAHFQYVLPFYRGCKYINTIHDLLFLDFPEYFSFAYRIARAPAFRWSHRNSALVLTVSDYCRQRIIHHYGTARPVEVLQNGIPDVLVHFQPDTNPDAWRLKHGLRNYVVCVSRFEPRKNQHGLLRAFIAGEHFKSMDLLLIGARSEPYPTFDSMLAACSPEVRAAVHIWDHGLPNEELYAAVKFARLFVYPSLAEGFGLPPLEAFVLGAPVLCSNSTAMRGFDFLGEGLVSMDALDQHLNQALRNGCATAPVQERMAVSKRYSWQYQAGRLYGMLADLEKQ